MQFRSMVGKIAGMARARMRQRKRPAEVTTPSPTLRAAVERQAGAGIHGGDDRNGKRRAAKRARQAAKRALGLE